VSYFNLQTAWKTGLATTSQGWVSIYPLSQNAGRVTLPHLSTDQLSHFPGRVRRSECK
jgi:hypothetical protein